MSTILVIGPSGTGKTSAINPPGEDKKTFSLPPKQTFIIESDMKPLPFRGYKKYYIDEKTTKNGFFNLVNTQSPIIIKDWFKTLQKSNFKYIVWDTITHAMLGRLYDEEKLDWPKYNKMGRQFFEILNLIQHMHNKHIVVIGHEDINDKTGKSRVRTTGKMLDNYEMPSFFTHVFTSAVKFEEGRREYYFETQTDGFNLSKAPPECFDNQIPNSYKYVFDTIEAYEKGE